MGGVRLDDENVPHPERKSLALIHEMVSGPGFDDDQFLEGMVVQRYRDLVLPPSCSEREIGAVK